MKSPSHELRRRLADGEEIRLPSLGVAHTLIAQRGIGIGTDPTLVPDDALADLTVMLYDRLADYSAAVACGISIVETPDGRPWPIITTADQPVATNQNENTTLVETGNVTFRRFYLGAYKRIGQAVVSNELMTDTHIDEFMDELATLLAEAVARKVDPEYIAGSGLDEPSGLVDNVSAYPTEASTRPTIDDLSDVSLSLDPAMYRGANRERLRWLMHSTTWKDIVRSRGGSIESAHPLADDEPLMLWQYPVVLSDDMPVGPDRGTRPIMFGHFGRAYIARQTETDVSVSAGALFKQDSKIARVRVRVDGRVRDSSAVVAIVVGPPAKIDTFTSNVATRVAGGSVTLTWTTTGATGVLLDGVVQTAVDGSATTTIPVDALTGDVITYELEAVTTVDPGLSTTATVSVTVS